MKEEYNQIPQEGVEKNISRIELLMQVYSFRLSFDEIKQLIDQCHTELFVIKSKLGEQNIQYINVSSKVVTFAFDNVLKNINHEIQIYKIIASSDNGTQLAKLKSSFSEAKVIVNLLGSFAMDAACKEQYSIKIREFVSLYNTYNLGSIHTSANSVIKPKASFPTPNPIGRRVIPNDGKGVTPSTTRTVNTKKKTPKQKDNSIGCFLFLFVGLFISIAFGVRECTGDNHRNPEDLVERTTVDSASIVTDDEMDFVIDSVADQDAIWLDQYKYNALLNGDTPYRSLYGGNSRKGDSKLIVKAPELSDVIVIVKDVEGNVVKHAYIRGGHSYSFTLRAGTYQPFFIFGNSWCPEKESPNGVLGYFLEDIAISKDDPQEIKSYESLTYTLKRVPNGNFNAQPSNESEAF